jgi:putative ABC transport system permease protein
MDSFLKDIRYAFRLLARSPLFTTVIVLTLALGLGTNSAVFSLANAHLFKPPAGVSARGLVWITNTVPYSARPQDLSFPDLEEYGRLGAFSEVAGFHTVPVALSGRGEPQRITGQIVTDNYFDALRTRPALGHGFVRNGNRQSPDAVAVVLSDGLWRRSFAADPAIVGRTVVLNGQTFSVVGVAPARFHGLVLNDEVQLWVPMAMQTVVMPGDPELLKTRASNWLSVVGRLKPGIKRAQAESQVQLNAAQIAAAYPAERKDFGARLTPVSGGLHPGDRGEVVPMMVLLLAVTGLVVLIACANVGNLLLARALARRKEIGIRLALGATRMRLIRQLLTESAILGLFGGAAGLLVSTWTFDSLLALAGAPRFMVEAITLDGRVLLFTLGLSLLTGLFFGLAPALNAVKSETVPALREDSPQSGGGPRRSRLTRGFVAAQVALSLILLVGAGLLVRSLEKALRIDPGFDTAHTLSFTFDPSLENYPPAEAERFLGELVTRVSSEPGVAAASLTHVVPLSGRMYGMGIRIGGEEAPGDRPLPVVHFSNVWPDYFRTLEIPLLSGRDFSGEDRAGAPLVAIVNESFARRFWDTESPLGKTFQLADTPNPIQVIGVARDTKYDELTEDPRPYFYLPERQHPEFRTEMSLIVRTTGDPESFLPLLRKVIRDRDPDLPLYNVTTFTEQLRNRMDIQRVLSTLLSCFAGLALLLAGIGLYGAMAFAVAGRTREIGIRMALGARREDVLRMIVGEGVRLAFLGVAIGLIPAVALSAVVSNQLYGVRPADLPTFSAVAVLVLFVAVLASYFPARRATRIDPMAALRCE